jgi:hypothetical protein
LSETLLGIAMKFKMKFSKLGLMAMTLGQMSCTNVSSVPRASLYPSNGILRLNAGDTYTAKGSEVWHSAARYAACEEDAINAVAALKQKENK